MAAEELPFAINGKNSVDFTRIWEISQQVFLWIELTIAMDIPKKIVDGQQCLSNAETEGEIALSLLTVNQKPAFNGQKILDARFVFAPYRKGYVLDGMKSTQ